jgi:hypothetical protein
MPRGYPTIKPVWNSLFGGWLLAKRPSDVSGSSPAIHGRMLGRSALWVDKP